MPALPNAAPLPKWWADNGLSTVFFTTHTGFASHNGADTDWFTPPTGASLTQMTLDQARFYNVAKQVFRLLEGSAAIGKAERTWSARFVERNSVYKARNIAAKEIKLSRPIIRVALRALSNCPPYSMK